MKRKTTSQLSRSAHGPCRRDAYSTNHEDVLALVETAINVFNLLVGTHEESHGEYAHGGRTHRTQADEVVETRCQRHLTINRGRAPEGFLS